MVHSVFRQLVREQEHGCEGADKDIDGLQSWNQRQEKEQGGRKHVIQCTP